MKKDEKNTNMSGVDNYLDEIIAKRKKTDYGRATRRIGALMDMNQKEMAVKLGMTPQQLSQLLKKDNWTDEQKKRVAEAFEIPLQGFESLAAESDLLSLYITNNTANDSSSIIGGQNNYTYHIAANKKENVEDIMMGLAETTKGLAILLGKLDEKLEENKNKK
ncbi:hypothetical protein [Dysgonomonas sp. ZJ279]|uniref:hypothetical protein n=1 Tax=Dysgonomonas sp. ZJ279 TaxID=2709796 RepID=UPI0013EC3D13|nr:hypothetical protein [Dysgonomonas sp. ZJ279]